MDRDPNLHLIEHPLIGHFLTLLRDKECLHSSFRYYLGMLTPFLVYEAMLRVPLPRMSVTVETVWEETEGALVDSDRVALVAILRAGLLMGATAQPFFPNAPLGNLGLSCHPPEGGRVQSIKEFLAMVPDLTDKTCFIFDPVISTGMTAVHALSRLSEDFGLDLKRVCYVSLVCSVPGLAHIRSANSGAFRGVPIIAAAQDPSLNEDDYVTPGLGDCGERIYGKARDRPLETAARKRKA